MLSKPKEKPVKTAKTENQKKFECWASHQDELRGRSPKWFINGYDDPWLRIAYMGWCGANQYIKTKGTNDD